MNKILLSFFIIILFNPLFAQKYDYVWQLGYRYRPNINFELNFNDKKAKIKTNTRNFDFYLTTSTTSHSQTGEMLFSTNGCNIFNKNFSIMDNGGGLNPSPVTDITCNRYGNAIMQGLVTLPLPEDKNDSLFYIFHQATNWVNIDRPLPIIDKLYTSIIDMKTSNGLGKVIKKNQILLNDTLDSGIMSVKHADGKSWWILVREYRKSNFYTYKLTQNGLDSPFIQSIGIPLQYECQVTFQSCFSPDGTKLASYSNCDGLYIFDFDRRTGKLSNFIRDTLYEEPGYWHGGCSISPNSQFLYALTGNTIYQYDLKATDIKKSKVLVAQYDGFLYPLHVYLTYGQLAPDCRIYVFSINGIQAFGYIKYPDRKGLACEVVQHGILLPKDDLALAGSVPNFPNYRLGVTPTYPCDSTIDFKVSTKDILPPLPLIAYPNPVKETLHFDYDNVLTSGNEIRVRVTNLIGQTLVHQKLSRLDTPLSINVENLPQGMYILNVEADGFKPFIQKFLKI